MKYYRLMLAQLAFGLVFAAGCGVDYGSGDSGGSGATTAASTTANFGVVGNVYFSTLSANNLIAPITWMVIGGVPLPDGLALTSTTGVVTGKPTVTAAGNFTVTFRATDSTGKTATVSVLFAIHPRTDRVSVNSSGTAGDGVSSTPSISGDGSLVAFVSQSTNLVMGVTGSQVYIHNRRTNKIEVISRDSNAATVNDSTVTTVNEGDGASSAPSISSDGSLVAFVSQSTNLVTGVSGGQQVYLRDRQTGLTTVVSKSTLGIVGNGVSSAPAISADGRYIAFVSLATNLVTGVTGQQIYLHDRQTGQTTLVSKDNSPTPIQGDGASNRPSISSDGRYIAFASAATNFASGVGGNQEIYIHDRLTGANGTTSLISKDSSATPGNGNSSTPSISGDGRFVAFTSLATNLVPGVTGQQIYLHDRFAGANGSNVLISHDNSGTPVQGNGNSSAPSISSNGQFVAFTSLATNLLAPASAVSGPQIYIHDQLTGTNGVTSLVSKSNDAVPVAGTSASATDTPSTNSDGGFVAFFSQATNLVTGSGAHIYVRALL
jgi:Tol biopolymer transport system component